jgi:hypothetical protein
MSFINQMVIGISVSLYDKFDDLGILLDIVRRNWEDNYYISVCSNHPEADKKITPYEDDIDHFEQGAQIRYDPSDESTKDNRKYRVHDTILTACQGAISSSEVSHVFHVHADAWQLSELSLRTLIEELEANDASVAFKIESEKFDQRYPPGVFPDQMWLIDAEEARRENFFDKKALDFPPSWSVHFLWPMICLSHFGWGRIYQYSNRTEERLWDETPVRGNPARPMFFNPEYGQVHIATEDFRGDYGKALQAHFLREFGLTDGERIQPFLEQYAIDEGDLFARLNEWISDLNSQLRWYGLSVEDFDYDMRKIRPLLDDTSAAGKLKRGAEVRTEGTRIGIILRSLISLIKLGESESDVGLRGQMLDDYYQQVLQRDDFPEKSLGESTIFASEKRNND